MIRRQESAKTVAALELDPLPPGPVLQPLAEWSATEEDTFAGWETPIAPRGGFDLPSGFAIVEEPSRHVLELTLAHDERALVTLPRDAREYALEAAVKPLQAEAAPYNDRADCSEAYVGLVFRMQDSRRFYVFAVEGRRRLVLYRREDAEWCPLAEANVALPDDYVTLQVTLDGDAMRCECRELGVAFTGTDTHWRQGRAGVRGIGRARISSLRITQTPSQSARDGRRRATRHTEERRLGAAIPNPALLRSYDLASLGGTPTFSDFAVAGRADLLVPGKSLRAYDGEAHLLWEAPVELRHIELSTVHTAGGRWIYGFTGERQRLTTTAIHGQAYEMVIDDELVIIEGATGREIARAKLPELDPILRHPDLSPGSLNLTGKGLDIIVREWRRDVGGGGFNLWAYDPELNPLWHRRVDTPYGHHYAIQPCDVTGDGLHEVLAGGRLYSATGETLWTHDLAHEMDEIRGAQHYDAAALGALSGDDAVDPVAFLFGGSAGLYIVDGLTGRTRMVHRIGHAQGRVIGKVRDDLPGQQLLAACRWGNMGILTLFSGHGDRLWTIQPDDIGQGATPITWGSVSPQLIWTNTTGPAQAFYDGYGRRVKELVPLRERIAGRLRRDYQAFACRVGEDPSDRLALVLDGQLHLYGPEGTQ